MHIVVVFPAPFLPSNPYIFPLSIFILIELTAISFPKRFVRFFVSIMYSVIVLPFCNSSRVFVISYFITCKCNIYFTYVAGRK